MNCLAKKIEGERGKERRKEARKLTLGEKCWQREKGNEEKIARVC